MTPKGAISRTLFRLLLAGVLIALLVRLGPKDRWVATGVVYYATPWVLIGAAFAGLALLGRRRWLWMPALLCVGLWLAQTLGPGGDPIQPGDLRVRIWNAWNPKTQLERVTQQILVDDPDLLFLTEATALGRWLTRAEAEALPERKVLFAGGGFTLIASTDFEILHHELRWFSGRNRYVIFDLRHQGGEPFSVILLDLDSNPFRPKAPLLRHIADAATAHALPVRVVLGDFNLPSDSRWFEELQPYRSAFREKGQGLEVAWPAPIPLLGLDQVWGDPQVEFRHAEYGPANGSDHRKLDVLLRLP